MDNVSIKEIADELGISSKDVLVKAKKMGIEVKAAQSKVTMEQAEYIANEIMNGKEELPLNHVSLSEIAKQLDISYKDLLLSTEEINLQLDWKEKSIIKAKAIRLTNYINSIKEIAKTVNMGYGEVILRIQDLNIVVDPKNKHIPQSKSKQIIDYLKTGKSDFLKFKVSAIANVYALSNEEIFEGALTVGIKLKNAEDTITSKQLEMITNKLFNKTTDEKMLFSSKKIEYSFEHKNILLKGVPGTGKSRTIDNIVKNKLNINNEENILRLNIHSSSSNTDLMQGIGITSNNGNIEYREKQGLILDFIQKATFNPYQAFALILEEIQENSLNELIGDLIYLIEDDKRAKNINPDDKTYSYQGLIKIITENKKNVQTIKMPNLVDSKNTYKKMLLPNNLYIFCTSNYRDDKKVIEDNLLRRFDVIEIYPKYKTDLKGDFKRQDVSDFLENLNKSIMRVCKDNGEIHPDRFMIGHSNWLHVVDESSFMRAFLKVIIDFKDIKDMHFEDFDKIIDDITFPFNIEHNVDSYQAWIQLLQKNCYSFLD